MADNIIRILIEPSTDLDEAYHIYKPEIHFLDMEGKFNDEEFFILI